MRTCTKCGTPKSLDQFNRSKTGAYGLASWCRECACATKREWHAQNRDKALVDMRAWKKANRERVTAAKRRWESANPERVAEMRRRWRERIQAEPALAARVRTFQAAYYRSNSAAAIARAAKWRREDPARYREFQRQWWAKNPDLKNKCRRDRQASELRAKPAWANDSYIRLFYKIAKIEEARTGRKHQVDHIVPLKSKVVCGLHCEHNLQVMLAADNLNKGNRHWPDMP